MAVERLLSAFDWLMQWPLGLVKASLANPYKAFVETPSVLMPLLVEVMRPFMELPSWTFYVALTEMVLSLRLVGDYIILCMLDSYQENDSEIRYQLSTREAAYI